MLIIGADPARTRPESNAAIAANVALRSGYLASLDINELVRIACAEQHGALSGVFLPVTDDAYLASPVRVMLVGQEPRAWGKSLHKLASDAPANDALPAYIDGQMQKYRNFASTAPGKSVFRQFHDQLHESLGCHIAPGRLAVAWTNLLALSLNRASARRASEIAAIAALSRRLLAVQLDVLRPDLVVFASGWRYDQFVKSVVGTYTTMPGLVPLEYWPFCVPDRRFDAFRVRHPRRLTADIRRMLFQSLVQRAGQVARDRQHAVDAISRAPDQKK